MESKDPGIRWGWLKIMYIYTVLSAGLLGLGVVLAPDHVISMMGWPLQDPVIFGVFGSIYVAFGLVSIVFAAIFRSYIIGDMIDIPFGYIFGKNKVNN